MLALADRSSAVSILHLIRRQAEQKPDSLALIATDTNERLTYAELCERVDAAARWLKAVSYTHLTLPTICSV